MRRFNCSCGNEIFFESSRCQQCASAVGFDSVSLQMLRLSNAANDSLLDDNGVVRALCSNHHEYDNCNWLVRNPGVDVYCQSCSLNTALPDLSAPERATWWSELERAKRRMLFTLLDLQIPVVSRSEDAEQGLGFAFLEDQRSHPGVDLEHVLTGFADGLITVNVLEAHSPSRELARVNLGEGYRTLLGHFRHETGHYYFRQLVLENSRISEFRELFGDETTDYSSAIEAYYTQSAETQWNPNFISRYAQAHPLEDFAECWAHYLHMVDTLETAQAFGFVDAMDVRDFDASVSQWSQLSVAMNELNRSMGLVDAYPFVLSEPVLRKLRFVHHLVGPRRKPRQ